MLINRIIFLKEVFHGMIYLLIIEAVKISLGDSFRAMSQ